MARRLLHLNGMRAFEAVARHMSFKKAADELGVTPAAVSQQVKTLEDYLGTQLFRRAKRSIFLTETAQAMLPNVREGFDLVAAGLSRGRALRSRRQLVVSVTPSVAAKWLMPRLERFLVRHPELDVRLDATTRLVDFSREDVDVAVRYGSGEYPGLEVVPLMSERAFPVCSAKLLGGKPTPREPNDLRHHTLIHDDSMPAGSAFPNWAAWIEAAGASDVDASRGLHVNASMLAIQAALDGQGVALGRSVLVEDDVATGRLIKPFAVEHPLRFGYYVVHPRRLPRESPVPVFSRWLLAEAREHADPVKNA
jgi:LysR family glycine cleavage system transcriptional activator